MSPLPRATRVTREGRAEARVSLTYDQRFLRRRRLTASGGLDFLADLPAATDLRAGDMFLLEDGRRVAVDPAPEPVLVIRGDLPRLAWHIGNRHTPCQIEPDRLVILRDHVLAAMLRGLGADLSEAEAPFTPEGGAYGQGRTLGHSHGPDGGHEHDHDHAQDHGAGTAGNSTGAGEIPGT